MPALPILAFLHPFQGLSLPYRNPNPSPFLQWLVATAVVGLCFWVWGHANPVPDGLNPANLAIENVRVVEGRTGLPGPLRTVLVKGDRIWKLMEAGQSIPAGYQVLDGGRDWLVPGLIDLAVFLSLEGRLPGDSRPARPQPQLAQHLKAGVTTVFDLNSSRPLQRDFLRDPERHRYPAAFFAGPLYTGLDGWRPPGRTPWENNLVELSEVEEIDGHWSGHVTFGYDLVFVSLEHPGRGHAAMDLEVLQALARRARHRGLPLVIHATTVEKISLALAVAPDLLVGSPRNQVMDEALLAAMKDSGIAWAPAVGEILDLWPGRKLIPELKRYDAVGSLPEDTRRSLLKLRPRNQWNRQHDLDQTNRETILANVQRAHEAGVPIVAASLAGLPGVTHGRGLHHEMDWLMLAGLPPASVLAGATGLAASVGKLDDRGRIRTGKKADMILLGADPSSDRDAHLMIRAVILGGQVQTGKQP